MSGPSWPTGANDGDSLSGRRRHKRRGERLRLPAMGNTTRRNKSGSEHSQKSVRMQCGELHTLPFMSDLTPAAATSRPWTLPRYSQARAPRLAIHGGSIWPSAHDGLRYHASP